MGCTLLCNIPKCCLLVTACCRYQGKEGARKANAVCNVDSSFFSAFIAMPLLASVLAGVM